MASKTFTAGTIIDSVWLNEVNAAVYGTIPSYSASIQNNTTAIGTNTTNIQSNAAAIQALQNTKGTSGGLVGMTGYNINFINSGGGVTSALTNVNTAPRTYTFPDKSITVAGTTNETLVQPTIKGYIEQLQSLTGATVTFDPLQGTLAQITLAANTTITLPTPVDGMCYTLVLLYNGVFTPTFTGGGTLRWANGNVAPTPTKVANAMDKYVFTCMGGKTLAQDGGRNF